MNFKGRAPEFGRYSVTTGSLYRFGGKKATRGDLSLRRILLQRSGGWAGKERKEGNGPWVQGQGPFGCVGSEWGLKAQ